MVLEFFVLYQFLFCFVQFLGIGLQSIVLLMEVLVHVMLLGLLLLEV